MKTEDRRRQLYDREYATLPRAFRGFENWRLGYIKRMFANLAVAPEDTLLDVGVGGHWIHGDRSRFGRLKMA